MSEEENLFCGVRPVAARLMSPCPGDCLTLQSQLNERNKAHWTTRWGQRAISCALQTSLGGETLSTGSAGAEQGSPGNKERHKLSSPLHPTGMVTAPADRQTWTDGTGTREVSFTLAKRSRPDIKNCSSSCLSALN
ncbi:hypothetical protein PAMP_008088 [Pampus punctatissimus]